MWYHTMITWCENCFNRMHSDRVMNTAKMVKTWIWNAKYADTWKQNTALKHNYNEELLFEISEWMYMHDTDTWKTVWNMQIDLNYKSKQYMQIYRYALLTTALSDVRLELCNSSWSAVVLTIHAYKNCNNFAALYTDIPD